MYPCSMDFTCNFVVKVLQVLSFAAEQNAQLTKIAVQRSQLRMLCWAMLIQNLEAVITDAGGRHHSRRAEGDCIQ